MSSSQTVGLPSSKMLIVWMTLLGCFTVKGSELEAAGRSASPLIFYANRDSIRYISTRNVSVQGVLLSGLQEVRSLALHVRHGWIFWSEYGSTTTINRMHLSTSATKEIILNGLGEVHDIAVEWESSLIYWTDYLHETIEVARIDGSHRKTLFWENVANPRAIVVDSRNGYMYWSETGWDFPRIERATLAGTERRIIMDEHPALIPKLLINGLVIDFSSDLLYWVDAQTDIIERMKLDEERKAETVHTTTSHNLYSFGLTWYEDILYASELRSRSIERVNVTAGEHLRNMGWLTEKMTYRIALNSSSREPSGMTDCKNNSACSHLCLLTPTGSQCACPNGFKLLPDNVTCNATGESPKPPVAAIEVRLMFGSIPSILEGRIEVRMKGDSKNEWGTVCNDHFDMRDAQVVCRMLNHSGAEFVVSYGSGSVDSPIWLDNLKCRGNEDSLMECKHRGWGQTNCGHFEDVGVKCKNDSAPTPPVVAPNMTKGLPGNVTIRLRGGPTEHEGLIEITHDGQVGTICDNDFDIKDAHVICRMLGFEGAWSTMCCGRYGTGTGAIWLDSLQCTGNETSLSECPHLGWGNYHSVCTHANDAGVYCIPNPVIPPDNIIRLAEGTSENEGRVEIFYKDRWGTICDDDWDLNDANVICRMLNYSGALAAPIFSAYDVGSGQIWLDDVNCVGNESSIEECLHGGWGNHDCSHNQDAGVICQTNESALPSYESKKSLLFSEHWRGIIFQVNLEGNDHRAAPLPIDHLRGLSAVGFDPVEELVYFAEYAPGIIQRSHLNGSDAETIVNGIYYANRLAIDHLTRNIYFSDSSKYRIDVATLDGKHRTGLISTVWPEGIALDLKNGHIYWASQGYPPTIERADLDGNNQKVIFNLTEDSHPSGLTVDYNLNRLYWTDRGVQEVYFIDLQTGGNQAFITREIMDPVDLAIHGDTVYVTDLGSGGAWDGGIYSSQLAGPGNFSHENGNVSKLIGLMKFTWGIDSYDKDNIFQTDPRGCQRSDQQCSHLCLNAPSGPHCVCPSDMELVNSTTCKYLRLILHTECYFSEIYKSPLGGDDLFSVANTLPLEQVACPSAIASHSAEEKIYWSDLTMKHIARSNLDSTNEEIILQNVSYSMAIAVDSYAGNIYFTDRDKKTVEVAKLDGKYRKVLIQSQMHNLVGLAIDIQRGYMYYSAWGNPTMINRAQLDGSDITTLVEFTQFPYQRPTALAIDVDENVLYWVGDQDPSLQYIDLRYPNSEIVYHIDYSNYLHYPLGLALDAHYFYWTDWLLGNVIRASRGLDSVVVELIPNQYTPRGVNIFNPEDVQDYHPCVEECSHLCLLKPGGYKCACSADTATPCFESINITNVFGCTNDPSLYFIDDHHIKCIDLDSTNNTYVSVKTVRDDLIKGGAIDLDHRERMVFWSDNALWTLNRMSLVTGESEVIIRDDLGQVDGIAVEWESGLLYWTDFIFERIEVATLDGKFRKTLISTSLYSPRGIAVDPKSGYLFWTDYGFDHPRIERADLTGENRTIVVEFGYDWYFQIFPMSVIIEYETETIYWIDRYDNYIDQADLDGNNKANLEFIVQNINPADLALYGDYLYWADRNSRSIEYFNKTEGKGQHYNFGHLTDDTPAGVVVSDESRQPVASPMNRPPCRINNGGCSHLCLLAPNGGSKCACPNGVELEAGGKTCSNATQPKPPPPPVPDLKVHLSGTNSSHEGRVEVYHQGRWGTVCDDHWGMSEATVVCKMLNFTGAIRVESFGPGNYSFPILMDNVKCRGDEKSIAACQHNGWEMSDCVHGEDVGVVCRNDSIPTTEGPTLDPGPHPELRVRLRSGYTSNQGRVEIYLNDTWGTVCDNNWGIEEANVICRMVGFSEGAWSTHCCGWYDGYSIPNQIWLDNVDCVGDETSIAECRHSGWGSHNCFHSDDVGVVCKYTPPPRPDQILRLADGVRDGEGRVEIFHDGHWGTICDDLWDTKDAQVVCGQLGYSEVLAAPAFATFGEGNGHIWLSDVSCLGNESSIEDCPHRGWSVYGYCYHEEDASVICSNETQNLDGDDFLLFCESRRKLCYFMPLPQEAPAQTMALKLGLNYMPIAISYDPMHKQMYWTDEYGRIFRAFINNGSIELVMTGIGNPMGIELDLVGRNIYFADYYGDKISIASLDGAHQNVLVYVPNPQAIALDSESGVMYYSSLGSSPMISKADMDGNNQQVIANLSSVTYYTFLDIVLDKVSKRLFFSDQTNGVIKYIDLTNHEIHTLISGNLHSPTGLALFKDTLYWTATGEGQFTGVVFKANLSDGAVAKAQVDSLGEPSGIYAHNSKTSQVPGPSPCENNAGCSQLCVVNPTGSRCMCKAGQVLAEDGISCILGDVIFVADTNHQKIYYAGLTEKILSPLPISNMETPTGIAFDPIEKRIYWTDPKLGIVARSTFDGETYEVIRENVSSPMGIDVDLVGGNVFWINSDKRTIEVSKLNGDHWKVLVYNLHPSPVDIALDTTRGYMYWSAEGYIERAELDGLNRRIIASLGETYYGSKIDARGLTLDHEMNRLYFVSYFEYALLYIDLDSGSHSVQVMLRNFLFFWDPFGVAVDDKYVYWNEYSLFGWVFRINKNDTSDFDLLLHGLYDPRGLAVKKGNYTRKSDNPCDGSCSHLCLVKPGGYKCACSDEDRNTPCSESEQANNLYGCESDNSLYFIDRHNIKCIDLKSVNSTYVSVKTVRSDLIQGGAIDIHYRGRMIYWSDNSLWTLNRMSLTSGEKEVIIRDNLGQIDGLAVEWESGLLYWTDFIYERIEVAKLDGSSRRTLLSDGIFSPRGIAVDPKNGFLFWTDSGLFDNPRIERLDLTGENPTVIVDFSWYQSYPMSVIVDYETETIHWIDRYFHEFQQADMDGNNVVYNAYIGQNISPTDLALLGDSIYWADRNSHSVEFLNKTQKLGMHYNLGHLTDEYPTGVVVSDKSRQPVAPKSPCRIHNGGCSHLCLVAPGGFTKCACPSGVKLEDDNMTCSDEVIPAPPPLPVPVVKVRLRGSNSPDEGRVEVYHQGRWGTVCDDHWGISEATVVCKMLNFSGANRVESFGPGNSSFPILMDNVKCRGDEHTIAACQHDGWEMHNCFHSEDAGVVCRNDSVPSPEGPTLSPGPHPELKVRLRSGITSNQGRVELFLNGTWGTICDDDWGIEEANVICRMLGYTEGAWSTHCCGWYDGYSTPDKIWLDDVHCVGDEESIAGCRHGGWGSQNCLHFDDVGVVCKYTPLPRQGQILRLADGIREGEGRVEIFHDGHWGTICDDSWDKKDADVVCRELGYREALSAPTDAFFGEGNGHIWLADVECLGNESLIEDCQHKGWNVIGYCFHEEDASVICTNDTRSPDADDFLLFCDDNRKLCHFQPLPPPNSSAQPIPLRITLDSKPIAVAYDFKEEQMYWTDYYGEIRRASIHNGTDEVVLRDYFLTGVQIDTVGRNIYFADFYADNIRVASLDGTYQAVLIDVEFPQGIVLDIESRYIYYVSHGLINTTIHRADMDGENQMLIETMPFILSYTYINLALDKPNKRLYFSDQTHDFIRYINLDNKEVRTFISGNLHHPRGLTLINNTLYWTSSGDGKFTGAVFKANITDNPVAQEMIADLGNPSAIYAHNSMITPDEALCQNNGGCEQLCLVTPNDQKCRCRSGMVLKEDGKTCTLGDVIFVADIGSQKISYSELTRDILTPLPISNVQNPTRVAFDPFEDRIYWTEPSLGKIARSKFNGEMYEVIRNNGSPTAIGLDLVGRNVFWINSDEGTIEVSNLNGDNWKVLISDPKPSPQDIVLDTTRGYMYWSALGFIESAHLDGSNRATIALGNTSFDRPFDALYITLDVPFNRIYFVSYDESAIFYIDLDSGNNSIHTVLQNIFLFFQPHGIAVDDQYLYWGETFWYAMVLRVNKTNYADVSVEVSGLHGQRGIAVKKGRYEQETIHPCSKNSCTHLCFKIPSGYKCDCPNITSDGQNCSPSVVVWPPPTTTTAPTTTAPPTTPIDYCASAPCMNGATCKSEPAVNKKFHCRCVGYFGGPTCSVDIEEETVQLVLAVPLAEFNLKDFILSIVAALNEECNANPDSCTFSESPASIVKRAVNGPFTQEDIYIPSDPKEVDGGTQVEYAVVKTTDKGKPTPVKASFVADVTKKNAAAIGRKNGGDVLSVKPKLVIKSTPAPQSGRSNAGVIAGVVVALGLVLITVALAVWYFRMKRTGKLNLPYVREVDKDESKRRTTAFENPGYDGAGTGDYDDIHPEVFSPFQETTEASGVSNPIYAEIGMTKMSSSEDIKRDEANGESVDQSDASPGELPKKEPLPDDKEAKPEFVEIIVQGEASKQEDPRYVSLSFGKEKEAKNDHTATEKEKEEDRYQTLTGNDGGRTAVILEENKQPNDQSQS